MPQENELALLLAGVVGHELANQVQPLHAALGAAQRARPESGGPLALARESAEALLGLAELLRVAALRPGRAGPFSLGEALEEAQEGLPPEPGGRVERGAGPWPELAADRATVVHGLRLLLAHAARAGAGQAVVATPGEPGGPLLRVSYGQAPPGGPALPAGPLLAQGGRLRFTPELALALVLLERSVGPASLRLLPGEGGGQFELWSGGPG